MSRKPKQIYEVIIQALEPFLLEHDFKIKHDKEYGYAFAEQSNPEVIYTIIFSPVWVSFGVQIGLSLNIRHVVINKILGIFNKSYLDDLSHTCRFANINPKLMHETEQKLELNKIVTESLIDSYVSSFQVFMNEAGWFFFSQIRSLNDFDHSFNKKYDLNKPLELPDRAFILRNASPGLIAAKLNHNPEYELLYEKYLDILIGFNNVDAQAELKALKAYMDAHSVEELLSL